MDKGKTLAEVLIFVKVYLFSRCMKLQISKALDCRNALATMSRFYSTQHNAVPLLIPVPSPITVVENKDIFDDSLSILTEDKHTSVEAEVKMTKNDSNLENLKEVYLKSVNSNIPSASEVVKPKFLFPGANIQLTTCGKTLTQIPHIPYLYIDASHPTIRRLKRAHGLI